MPTLVKIPIQRSNTAHQRFEWYSGDYKKLKAVFCSPDTQLSMLFENGRKVFVRGLEFEEANGLAPNQRNLQFSKSLDKELISGIVSRIGNNKRPISVYLIVEK